MIGGNRSLGRVDDVDYLLVRVPFDGGAEKLLLRAGYNKDCTMQTLYSLLLAMTSAMTSALDFFREGCKTTSESRFKSATGSTNLPVIVLLFVITESTEMSFVDNFTIDLTYESTELEISMRNETKHTSTFVIVV